LLFTHSVDVKWRETSVTLHVSTFVTFFEIYVFTCYFAVWSIAVALLNKLTYFLTSAVCDGDSQFERAALVETVRRRVGSGSIAVTLTAPAISVTQSSQSLAPYVIHALLYACIVGCHW